MKSTRLVSLYYEHMERTAASGEDARLSENENPAILFGMEQIKLISPHKSAIKLPGIGWVSCPGAIMTAPKPEWVGIVKDGDGWFVVFGGGNPYTNTENGLPLKNGRVIAVPFALYRTLLTGDFA